VRDPDGNFVEFSYGQPLGPLPAISCRPARPETDHHSLPRGILPI
jgi:hypothetical protein